MLDILKYLDSPEGSFFFRISSNEFGEMDADNTPITEKRDNQ